LQSNYGVTLTVPTPTRKIQERLGLGVTMKTPWMEGWSFVEEYRPSGVKQSSHLMRHVEKKRPVEWHLVILSESF
jgi:hypothetical protein